MAPTAALRQQGRPPDAPLSDPRSESSRQLPAMNNARGRLGARPEKVGRGKGLTWLRLRHCGKKEGGDTWPLGLGWVCVLFCFLKKRTAVSGSPGFPSPLALCVSVRVCVRV